MKRAKRAIGYVCEIPVPGTDMVISKNSQLERIRNYAAKEGIELAAIYEDSTWTDDFSTWPGVQMLLDAPNYDCVLVERVWCFSRNMSDLKPFITELEKNNHELVASTCLWDCVSQQIRHRYMGTLAQKVRVSSWKDASCWNAA
jgi:DNA invertase Pin-like site-specific DNA recombinase